MIGLIKVNNVIPKSNYLVKSFDSRFGHQGGSGFIKSNMAIRSDSTNEQFNSTGFFDLLLVIEALLH